MGDIVVTCHLDDSTTTPTETANRMPQNPQISVTSKNRRPGFDPPRSMI
jgi:hypothetical protein